jgi:uncharacterized membrane protein
MFATIVLVYGIGAKSLAALLGTAASLLLTVVLASAFTAAAHITGRSQSKQPCCKAWVRIASPWAGSCSAGS